MVPEKGSALHKVITDLFADSGYPAHLHEEPAVDRMFRMNPDLMLRLSQNQSLLEYQAKVAVSLPADEYWSFIGGEESEMARIVFTKALDELHQFLTLAFDARMH